MIEILDNTIPNNWTVVELDSLVNKIIGGGTPSRSNDAYYKGDIPWMTVKDMTSRRPGKISEHITLEAVANSSTNLIPPHTIIIATRMSLGKIVMLPFEVAINQDLKALIIPEHIDKYYVEHWFTSCSEYLKSLGTGTTVKGIRLEVLKKLSFPLPPLNEQKRIVTKIEALQTRSTAVKEELEAIKPLLNRFRQSVLAAAFRGDLTKDWRSQNPDVEPAKVLLKRIRVERRRCWEEAELEKMKAKGKVPKDDKWKKKYKEPKPIDVKSDYLLDLPDQWLWLSADQCSYLITDGEHATPKRSDSGVYLLSARNILNGTISYEKVDFVPEDVYKKLEQRLKLEAGDVLMSCSGTVGRSCVAPQDLRCAFVRSVAILKTVFETGEYISLAIRSPILQTQIEKKKTQTAQSNIFQGRIKILAIPFAPLEEQKEIVRRIESLFKLADNIEQQYQQAEIDLETLNQSILAKAFRGELVPQDPNDEPASVLLERIKEEREKAKATAKKSKTKKKSSKKKDKQLGIPGM